MQGVTSGPIDGVSTPGPAPGDDLFTLIFKDACVYIDSHAHSLDNATYFSAAGCAVLDDGVLRSGLQAGVLRYLSLATRAFTDALASRAENGGTLPPNFNTTAAAASARTATRLLHPYLLELGSMATVQTRIEVAASLTEEAAVLFAISASLVLVQLIALLVYFLPHLKRHGEDTVATQILLTVLPSALLTADIDMHEAVVEAVESVEAAFPQAGVLSSAHKYIAAA
ncbi:unnamed protein product [Symbiodinium sp. KB8]|nr:unnamed protein product [Symbiodinium sp. KB8]